MIILRRIFVLSYFCLFSIVVLVVGCKKKDRLSSNTYQLSVVPSATSVAKNNPRTFTAQAIASNGSFQVEPTWQVLEATAAAVITPPIGQSVSVSFPNTGVYTLVADFDDRRGTAQIRVDSSTSPSTAPPLNAYLIYTDAGIPAGANLFTNLGTNLAEQVGTFDAPEGLNYMRASNMTSNFWMVDLSPSSVNLSDYPGGKLRFFIRKSRAISIGEVLIIQMQQPGGSKATIGTNTGFWSGFSSSSTDWQAITIDLSRFFGGAGTLRSPFIFSTVASSLVTIDIDSVRWEKN